MLIVVNALMGLPPVVVGLLVYLHLSRSGPLGFLGLLYSPTAMIIAQTILIAPIVIALSRQTLEDLHSEYDEQFRALSLSRSQTVTALLWDGRFALLTVALAGFGRAVAEVGAVMIVGGNIDHLTRVMTTTIALETSKGNLPLALALGMVFFGRRAARQGTRNRPERRRRAVELHQRLWRRAHNLQIVEIEVEHIGGRVDQPHRPVDLEWRHVALAAEQDRQNDLVDVASRNVFLARVDALAEFRLAQRALRRARCDLGRRPGHGSAQAIADFAAQALALVLRPVVKQGYPPCQVIEHQ